MRDDRIRFFRDKAGRLHRDDGPASIWPDGTRFWFRHGKLHRVGGPAIDWAWGGREWYQYGEKHRSDGPATEWPNGGRRYWLRGRPLSEEEFKAQRRSSPRQLG